MHKARSTQGLSSRCGGAQVPVEALSKGPVQGCRDYSPSTAPYSEAPVHSLTIRPSAGSIMPEQRHFSSPRAPQPNARSLWAWAGPPVPLPGYTGQTVALSWGHKDAQMDSAAPSTDGEA